MPRDAASCLTFTSNICKTVGHFIFWVSLKVKDVNSRNILLALVNTDFGSMRKPSLRGECFFINHTKGLVLLLYDDRGMDIVALKKDVLQNLYKSHNAWILDYDREKIDSLFS